MYSKDFTNTTYFYSNKNSRNQLHKTVSTLDLMKKCSATTIALPSTISKTCYTAFPENVPSHTIFIFGTIIRIKVVLSIIKSYLAYL